ncbi:MAG: M42 family metallopeptidase [Ruminococcus sp.]|nr:M42 family metallopeptidase [Ruminococcus sp.]
MIDFELLGKLCRCNGISGDESTVREIIIDEIKEYAESIETDNLGNLIVHKKGRNRAINKLMLSAHMDEVGLMVTDITSDGYIKFDEVGGIDKRILIGKQVTIGNKNVNGVIGIKPIHLCKGDESTAIPKISEMYIDIGANSKEEALQYIYYGDSINFASDFEYNNYTIKSKALDDRFGCYVLIQLIKSELEFDIDFVFAVQEEVGLRGAKTASYSVNPEFAIVVETTTAADVPEVEASKKVCSLGSGAVISIMDRRTIYDKELVKTAFDIAEKSGIKAQYKTAIAGGNDAGVIHQSRSGVRTLAISLPCRYLHAPSCIVNREDCESTLKLVSEIATRISGGNI